jgi:hypothetical protein
MSTAKLLKADELARLRVLCDTPSQFGDVEVPLGLAEFILATRDGLLTLLDEVERLTQQLDGALALASQQQDRGNQAERDREQAIAEAVAKTQWLEAVRQRIRAREPYAAIELFLLDGLRRHFGPGAQLLADAAQAGEALAACAREQLDLLRAKGVPVLADLQHALEAYEAMRGGER